MSALGTTVTIVGSVLGVLILVYIVYRIVVCCAKGAKNCWREFLWVFCCRSASFDGYEEYSKTDVTEIEQKLDIILERIQSQRDAQFEEVDVEQKVPDVSRLSGLANRARAANDV